MMTSKACYVRLNRNFLDSIGTIKVNNLAELERKNSKGKVEYLAESPNSCSETSHSELSDEEKSTDEETTLEKVGKEKRKTVSKVIDGNNHKLRKKRKVKYFPESPNSHSETSHSEFSEEESCTDEETMQEKVGKKKKVVKTEKWKKLICLHCDKSFSTYKSYLMHKYSLVTKQFRCSVCNLNIKDRQTFVNHMKNFHPEVKPFLCNYKRCEQSFKTQKLLEIHKRTHFKFMCKYCKKLFVTRYFMRKHVLKIH